MDQLLLRSSEKLIQSIIEQLSSDERVESSDIHVDVHGATALLTGTVPSYADRRHAELIAAQTPGIAAVENTLAVEPPSYIKLPSDDEIAAAVQRLFALTLQLSTRHLQVSVEDGAVTLEGIVETYWQKIRAEEITADAAGVREIRNKLVIVPTELPDDESIARSIVTALDRTSRINTSLMNISVTNGAVTISGTVQDWIARKAVQEIALFTEGVREVVNELSVKPLR